jgi:hypothetical protein
MRTTRSDFVIDEADSVLEVWRQADATPSITDTADDLRRAASKIKANVLVGEVEKRLIRQGARRITALVEKITRGP